MNKELIEEVSNEIDLLTGYLWDEEESSGIKESDGTLQD